MPIRLSGRAHPSQTRKNSPAAMFYVTGHGCKGGTRLPPLPQPAEMNTREHYTDACRQLVRS